MNHTNSVLLFGVLARDPELRYTPDGLAIFTGTVAGEDRVIDHQGKERVLPWYHQFEVVGNRAEPSAALGLARGVGVKLDGRLNYQTWETESGEKRSKVNVKALDLRLDDRDFSARLVEDRGGGVRLAADGGAFNVVVLSGNLSRDAELRYTPSGDAVINVGIASTESWPDSKAQTGFSERAHFIDGTLWRELAEANADAKKGSPVSLLARLVNDAWTDKSGQKRNQTKLEIQRFVCVSKPAEARPADSQPAQTDAPPPAPVPNAELDLPF